MWCRYALLVADTIRVTNDRPVVFTEDAPKSSDTVFFYFNDDEEEQAEEKKEVKKEPSAPKATAILKSKFRSEEQNVSIISVVNEFDMADAFFGLG